MNILSSSLLLIAVSAPPNADSAPNAEDSALIASVAVTVSGVEVRARVTEDGRDVALSVGNKGAFRVGLPESESVSEVRIGRWMSTGIALAIETRNSKTREFSYYWSTAMVDPQASQTSKPVADRFLKSKVDYDVVGVVNSQSDSICITLLRHRRRKNSQSFDGHIYVHNCPVAPIRGVLLPLVVTATDTQNR